MNKGIKVVSEFRHFGAICHFRHAYGCQNRQKGSHGHKSENFARWKKFAHLCLYASLNCNIDVLWHIPVLGQETSLLAKATLLWISSLTQTWNLQVGDDYCKVLANYAKDEITFEAKNLITNYNIDVVCNAGFGIEANALLDPEGSMIKDQVYQGVHQ